MELFSSSIVFFILFFKDQLLSSASLRSLQATGISIPTFSQTQEFFFFFCDFLEIDGELPLLRQQKTDFSPMEKAR